MKYNEFISACAQSIKIDGNMYLQGFEIRQANQCLLKTQKFNNHLCSIYAEAWQIYKKLIKEETERKSNSKGAYWSVWNY